MTDHFLACAVLDYVVCGSAQEALSADSHPSFHELRGRRLQARRPLAHLPLVENVGVRACCCFTSALQHTKVRVVEGVEGVKKGCDAPSSAWSGNLIGAAFFVTSPAGVVHLGLSR